MISSDRAMLRLGFAAQGRALLWRLSIIFVALALLIEVTLFAYWRYSLQPRLQSEAQAQISLLAQSQAPLLAQALAAPPTQLRNQMQAALDQLLLLKGPSGKALIEGVSLEVDNEALGIDDATLAGLTQQAPTGGNASEVALYHPDTGELIGIAKLWVSNAFYERFVADVQRQMLLQALLLAACLSLLWAGFSWLIHRHEAQRQRDAELIELARDQALQASRAKSQFLANMSHEIRTPMNAVLGIANLLKKSTLLPKQQSMLSQLTESAKLLLGVLNDILDLSRIEANKLAIQDAPFRLRHALRSLQHMLQQRAADKSLALEFPDATALPLNLNGDVLRLQQVLVNLLINAIKFTDAGSVRLQIQVRPGPTPADAKTQVEKNLGIPVYVRFAVIDTGVGISTQDQKRLFDPFSQVDESDTRVHGGAGLGLAISKRLVELMGGTLQCHSELGKGSEFAFELPMHEVHEPEVEVTLADAQSDVDTRQTQPWPGRLQGRVLVVEDHPINREVAQALLEALGLVVHTATGGKEALALLQEQPGAFDLVLMDIQMPEWDGIESTARIKAVPALADLPIVALTAHAMSGDRERFLAQGMDDYLCKPLDEAELITVLKRFMPSVAATSQLSAGARQTDVDQAAKLVIPANAGIHFLEDGFSHSSLDPGVRRDDEFLLKTKVCGTVPHQFDSHPLGTATSEFTTADEAAGVRWQAAGIDWHYGLRNLGGNQELLERLLMDFCQRHNHAMTQLQALHTEAHSGAEQRMLHTLRGAAAALGAKTLTQAAATLEQQLRAQLATGAALLQFEQALTPLLACAELLKTASQTSMQAPASISRDQALILRDWLAGTSYSALQNALMQMDLQAGEQLRAALAQTPALQQPALLALLQPVAAAIDQLDYTLALEQLGRLRANLGDNRSGETLSGDKL